MPVPHSQPPGSAHWFNWLLYPKWKLNFKAVMFEVTPSTILFYFRVPDLTSVTWYLPFQQERFTRSCLPEAATDKNQQAAFISSAQKKHTCFLGEPPRKCNIECSTEWELKKSLKPYAQCLKAWLSPLKEFLVWFLGSWVLGFLAGEVCICFVYSFLDLKQGKWYSLARNPLTPLTLRKYHCICRLHHIFCLKVSLRLLALSTVSRNVFSSQYLFTLLKAIQNALSLHLKENPSGRDPLMEQQLTSVKIYWLSQIILNVTKRGKQRDRSWTQKLFSSNGSHIIQKCGLFCLLFL